LSKEHYISKPEAFHLWVSGPPLWNAVEFSGYLRSQGVAAVAADAFAISAAPEAVRLCLGGPTDRAACRQALEIVRQAIGMSVVIPTQ